LPDVHSVEVIVAANGCSDDTVRQATRAHSLVRVLDLEKGSKTAAINAANRIASVYPRIILDADVECSFQSLSALALALRDPGIMVVAPAICLNLTQANWFMKAYYRAWMKQAYAKAGRGGAGCYGLSKKALEAVGEFPDIVGDDIWIHTRFPDEQRRYVHKDAHGESVFSIVRPPRTAWNQVKVECRRMLGNAEVHQKYPSKHLSDINKGGGLRGVLKSRASLTDTAIYVAVKLLVRLRMSLLARQKAQMVWTRDHSSRQDF
jgi:hypothetical protein